MPSDEGSERWSEIPPPLFRLPDYGQDAVGEDVARDFGGIVYYGSVTDFDEGRPDDGDEPLDGGGDDDGASSSSEAPEDSGKSPGRKKYGLRQRRGQAADAMAID